MSNTATSSGGIGFCGLLTILFIALKLTGVISWSWWWILSPIWIPFAVGIVGVLGFLTVTGIVMGISALIAFIISKTH